VNSLGSQHVDERELLLSKYESELTTLHQSQYREFREVPVLFLVSLLSSVPVQGVQKGNRTILSLIVKLSPSTRSSERYPYYS
jgi:hypothetical protein